MFRLLLLVGIVGTVVLFVLRWRRERREEALARLRSAFFVLRADRSADGRESLGLKTITLADGQLRFRVPERWQEEPAAGAFCAKASSSRRLRVELRAQRRVATSAATLAEALRQSPAGRKGVVEVLSGERVLLKHVEWGGARQDAEVSYCWELAAPEAPGRFLLAEFRFSLPQAALDAITLDDLSILEAEIRDAALAQPA